MIITFLILKINFVWIHDKRYENFLVGDVYETKGDIYDTKGDVYESKGDIYEIFSFH